jgi:hypothetical protein
VASILTHEISAEYDWLLENAAVIVKQRAATRRRYLIASSRAERALDVLLLGGFLTWPQVIVLTGALLARSSNGGRLVSTKRRRAWPSPRWSFTGVVSASRISGISGKDDESREGIGSAFP